MASILSQVRPRMLWMHQKLTFELKVNHLTLYIEKYPAPNDRDPNRAHGLGPLLSTSNPTGMPAIYIPRFPNVPCHVLDFFIHVRLLEYNLLLSCFGLKRASSSPRRSVPTLSRHTVLLVSR